MKRQRVLVGDPHPQSMAALALLGIQLSEVERAEWLEFRLRFFKKQPELTCLHCGKTDLLVDTPDLHKLATVDHIVPLSKGGPMYDEDNCLVACFRCNNNRKNQDLEEFRKKHTLSGRRL